jgi:RHS repeat-associated protein
VTDNAGHTKTYAYDSVFGNVGQTNLPGGRTTSRSYDAIGRVRTVQSLGSALQTTDYDILNRPTAIYDGVNATPTRIAYDALFSTSVTDPKNQIYKNDNNALGWVVRQYDPNTSYGSKLMRYDASGRLTGLTNRRGQKLIFSYDVLDRLLSKTGTNVSPETFSYAADGRTAVASSTVETDSLFVNPITGADSTVIVLAGRRFRIAHTSHNELSLPDTTNISNTAGLAFYDRIFSADQSTGALGSLTLGGTQVQFSYNSDGLRSTNSFNNQSQTYTSIHTILEQSYGYNSLHRRAYHYDLAGRIDVQQREGEPWGTYTAIERTFGYDQLGRLTRVETRQEPGCLQWPGGFYDQDSLSAANGWRFTCGSHAPTTDAFSYDAVGNRTDNGASSIVGNRYATLNGVTYTYDLDGNVTKKSKPGLFTRSYVWSAENRLLSAVDGTATVRYEYNAYGQPVVKWVGSGGSEHIDRFFIWDGEQLLAILDSALQRLEEYTYGFGIDEPVVFMSSWETRAPVQDALGNFRGFGDQSIFDTQVTNYDTWGTPTVTGPQSMSLLWKGLLWEGDVAHLYYARNRWYDPDAGRFMSEDPVGISAGLNQYVFANNDPVNGRDPSGLNAWITCEYTPGYETGTNPVISYAGTWQCYGGGGSTDSESQSGPSSYDPGHGGGGGSGGSGKPLPPKPGTDVGQHAERVCQAAIGLTAASFFLETVGAIQLYKGVKGIAAARGAAQFAETFTHPVPDAIRAYTRGRARAAEWSTAREYASGWAHGGLISYFGEAATGAEHTWWGYLPLPYASTASFGKATALACFYPGGN